MTEAEAKGRAETDGWVVREDAGRGWRRVVASPRPIRIVEERAVKTLLREDFVVITVGGGGIPVVADDDGNLRRRPGGDRQGLRLVAAGHTRARRRVHDHHGGRKGRAQLGQAQPALLDADARQGQGISGRGHALRRGQHGAQDRGVHPVPGEGRGRGDHHQPREAELALAGEAGTSIVAD